MVLGQTHLHLKMAALPGKVFPADRFPIKRVGNPNLPRHFTRFERPLIVELPGGHIHCHLPVLERERCSGCQVAHRAVVPIIGDLSRLGKFKYIDHINFIDRTIMVKVDIDHLIFGGRAPLCKGLCSDHTGHRHCQHHRPCAPCD